MAAANAMQKIGLFLSGALFAVALAGAGLFFYLRFGQPPVATADAAFPLEVQVVRVPLGARIEREMRRPPFVATEDTLEAGAAIYKKQCENCHGTPGHDASYAQYMYPKAPQLWKSHGRGVVGVSDDEAGETYWKVANGIRLTGMPAYQHLLSETEMWDVSLLLKMQISLSRRKSPLFCPPQTIRCSCCRNNSPMVRPNTPGRGTKLFLACGNGSHTYSSSANCADKPYFASL